MKDAGFWLGLIAWASVAGIIAVVGLFGYFFYTGAFVLRSSPLEWIVLLLALAYLAYVATRSCR